MNELQKKSIPALTAICLQHVGSYNQIGAAHRELNAWARERGVKAAGPAFTIFLNPPNEFDSESARFEVCLPVGGAPKADGKVTVRDFAACSVAYAVVKGPYDEIPAHYAEALAWMDAQGLDAGGAPREVYIKRPDAAGKTKPEEYVTEIQFPVRE